MAEQEDGGTEIVQKLARSGATPLTRVWDPSIYKGSKEKEEPGSVEDRAGCGVERKSLFAEG